MKVLGRFKSNALVQEIQSRYIEIGNGPRALYVVFDDDAQFAIPSLQKDWVIESVDLEYLQLLLLVLPKDASVSSTTKQNTQETTSTKWKTSSFSNHLELQLTTATNNTVFPYNSPLLSQVYGYSRGSYVLAVKTSKSPQSARTNFAKSLVDCYDILPIPKIRLYECSNYFALSDTSTISDMLNSQNTREARQTVTKLGYNFRLIDSDYNQSDCYSCVRAYQLYAGIAQDDWIDYGIQSAINSAKTADELTPTFATRFQMTTASSNTRASSYMVAVNTLASYFTLGSHQDDVLRIQGTPSSMRKYYDREVWTYGLSSVDFSLGDSRVTEWNNISGNLRVQLNLTTYSNVTDSQYFTLGSHQDDVLRIQGTPSSMRKYYDREVWTYGLSSVDFSLGDGRVTEWNNISGNLRVQLNLTIDSNVTDSQYFTLGSHQNDVLRIQGTPSSMRKYYDREVWTYGLSSVDFSLGDSRVTEWNNISGNLRVQLNLTTDSNVTDNQYFTLGSHQDDVLRIQGTPSSMRKYYDREVWTYGLSSVDFSLGDSRVTEWNNISGNLRVQLNLTTDSNVTDSRYFTLGSHQDDVLRIQGTPSSMRKYYDREVWTYGLSSVDFSLGDSRVTEWNNISGNLKVR